jgi:hypothetical protein
MTGRAIRRVAHAVTLALLVVLACAATAHADVVVSKPSVSVTEGGSPDTYDIQLGSMPSQDVSVQFDVPPGIKPIPAVTFDSGNWNQPQPVVVDAFDDVVHLASPGGTITHSITIQSTGDTIATGDAPVLLSRFDNDYPLVFLDPDPGAGPYAEGDTAHWFARLGSRPSADVTIDFSVDASEGSLLTPSVTITPDTWDQPHPVDVVLADDDVDQSAAARSVQLLVDAVSSADPDYDNRTVPPGAASFEDDDVAGVLFDPVSPTPVQVTEGGQTGSYQIRLATEPIANVTVNAAPLSTGQLTVSPTPLVFTPADWDVAQTVTVTAVDDTAPEPGPVSDRILHSFSSSDPSYSSPNPPDVYVNITDNDSPAFLVTSPASNAMAEADAAGTERTISMRLATAPAGNVRVVGISDGQVGLVGASALTFTPTNWATPQELRVQPIDDTAAEPNPHVGRVSFSIIAPNDAPYAAQSIPAEVFSIADDDLANASLTCLDGPNWSIDAGGHVPVSEDPAAPDHSVGCYLQTGTAPTADVTLAMTADLPSQLDISPATVTIPAGSTSSTLVTVTAVDDARAEARPHLVRMSFATTTTDAVYGAMVPAPVQFAVADNDLAGVKLTPTGPHSVAEGGADLALAVTLSSQPTSQVTLTVDPGSQLRVVSPVPASLLFTPSNWNVPQQVTVAALDDLFAEPGAPPAPLQFTVSSSDTTYQSLPVPTFPFAVVDDDRASVKVTPTDADTSVSEGGTAGDSFGLQLGSQPTAPVTITLDNDAQITAAPTTLTFTSANWNVAQSVTVTAVQDAVFEGAHVGLVRLKLASADPAYDTTAGASFAPIEVKVSDDEQAGATIAETDGATVVKESGGTDTYTIVLNAEPAGNVAIRADGGTQVTTQPGELTFTPANWSTPQTITVAAVQDTADEVDPHNAEIKHVVTSTATGWAGAQLSSVTAKVGDDDDASVVVTQTEGDTRVVEGGASDKVTVRLSSQPVGDVTLTPTGDAQLMIEKQVIVLTPANWNTAVEVKVVAKDDEEDEGDHTGTLTIPVASADPSYAKATVSPIEVKIADDDGSTRTITPGDGTGGDDDGGAGGGDDGRKPRGTTGGNAGRGGNASNDGATTDVERSDGDSGGSDGATDEATDDGLTLGVVGAGGNTKDDAEETPELDGEAVSATERAPKHAKPRKPNRVQRAVRKAVKWTKANQETVATVGGVGLMATGAGTFFLRGDPIKVAQRGLTALDGASKVPGGPDKPHPRLRRARGKKRRKDDEEAADAGSPTGDGPD